MDIRKQNQPVKDYLEFTNDKEPDKTFICTAKIDPSTCSFVIVYRGLQACLKCKNFVDKALFLK